MAQLPGVAEDVAPGRHLLVDRRRRRALLQPLPDVLLEVAEVELADRAAEQALVEPEEVVDVDLLGPEGVLGLGARRVIGLVLLEELLQGRDLGGRAGAFSAPEVTMNSPGSTPGRDRQAAGGQEVEGVLDPAAGPPGRWPGRSSSGTAGSAARRSGSRRCTGPGRASGATPFSPPSRVPDAAPTAGGPRL